MRVAALRILLVVLLGAGSWTAERAAREARSERSEDDMQYLPSGEFLQVTSVGYDEMAADLLWLRAMMYYGEWRKGGHGIAFFEHLADVVVTLDPSFEEAYRFAGLVLSEDMARPDAGIDFLRRGMKAIPDSWWLPFEAGFIEYTVNVDDEAAYRWFRHAAEVEGAPEYPRRFAAFVAGRAGDLEVSYELWRAIAATTQNEGLREKALQYVAELEAAMRGEAPVPEWARRKRVIQRGKADDDA